MFCFDILRSIGFWLNDRDRFFMMITCKKNRSINLNFEEEHSYLSIIMVSFYNNFTNIIIDDCVINAILPKYTSSLTIYNKSNVLVFNKKSIPFGITHLKFKKPIHTSLVGSLKTYENVCGKRTKIYENAMHFHIFF